MASKQKRRATAFYPHINSTNRPQKPFSRSAAKRESVMALGSIEHLQHYFTKTGIAAKKQNIANMTKLGLVPAIGGKTHVRNNSSLNSISDLPLPPSPSVPIPNRPSFPIVKNYEVNPESLLPGVIEDLITVSNVWEIQPGTSSSQNPDLLGAKVSGADVLGLLKLTTRAIRSVRNYMLSLPDESAGTLRAQFRSKLTVESAPVPIRIRSQAKEDDPLTLLRRSALEVLAVLRDLEERSRIPLSDDAYDAQSDRSGRVASPCPLSDDEVSTGNSDMDPDSSVAFSVVRVNGREESIMVWEEEEDDFNADESEKEKKELWDERLVLGSGWLYKQDIKMNDLSVEQDVIRGYLDIVDEVLFGGRTEAEKKGLRGWDREKTRLAFKEEKGGSRVKNRRVSGGDIPSNGTQFESRSKRRVVSLGMADALRGMTLVEEPETMQTLAEEEEEYTPVLEGDSVDEDELPLWAQRSTFPDDILGRIHCFLADVLPSHLVPHLSPPSPPDSFLTCLASGQLLCSAYNSAIRRSKEPWGYVNKDSIHDIIALEQAGVDEGSIKENKSWTFRRIDNLRLWTGALKIRYILPIIMPSVVPGTGSSNMPGSPTLHKFPEPPIHFDPKVVAKRGEGWQGMLQMVLVRWAEKVIEETRACK